MVSPRCQLRGWALEKIGRDWKATCFFANKLQERVCRNRQSAAGFIERRVKSGIIHKEHGSGIKTTTQFYDEV